MPALRAYERVGAGIFNHEFSFAECIVLCRMVAKCDVYLFVPELLDGFFHGSAFCLGQMIPAAVCFIHGQKSCAAKIACAESLLSISHIKEKTHCAKSVAGGENASDIGITEAYVVTVFQFYIGPWDLRIRHAAVMYQRPFRHFADKFRVDPAHVNACAADGFDSLGAAEVVVVAMGVDDDFDVLYQEAQGTDVFQ